MRVMFACHPTFLTLPEEPISGGKGFQGDKGNFLCEELHKTRQLNVRGLQPLALLLTVLSFVLPPPLIKGGLAPITGQQRNDY